MVGEMNATVRKKFGLE